MKTLLILAAAAVFITPKPVGLEPVTENGSAVEFTLPQSISVWADAAFFPLVSVWNEQLHHKPSSFPEIGAVTSGELASIFLVRDNALAAEEYAINMDSGRITVKASEIRGAWWALQTLNQMFIPAFAKDGPGASVPAVNVKDRPLFGYRGAHLDCCRHFWTVDQIKEFIDILCIHKLNTFHWHLTEDQGWRIEIKKYPLLTELGAVRKETLVGHYRDVPRKYDHTPYGEGMFYTQDQIREVVAYASARCIDIIPEIEMPGHMVAALTAYPELGCTGGPYEVWTRWGISDDVLCLGKEGSYGFLEDVLDEVCALFPGRYIHIGGDEAPVVRRKTCPHCQAKMKELGLKDEVQLQGYLVSRMEEYLKAKGRELIGWDEILDGGISRNAIVMSWRGAKGGIEAARQGNRVIMTPSTHFYLDYYQAPDPETEEPLAIGGRVTLEQCYSFDPYDRLTEDQKQYIIGIQANMWTEYVAEYSHLQHMVLPRYAALAEDGWGGVKDAYPDFLDRVKGSLVPEYQFFGFNYAPYEFE